MNSDQALERLLDLVKSNNVEVPKIQIADFGGLFCVTAYSEEPTTIMANDVTTGMDFDLSVATSKAIVEFLERRTFADGVASDDPICHHTDSDGMAAYPSFLDNCKEIARTNAYAEALERFVWANWWDRDDIGHTIEIFEPTTLKYSFISDSFRFLQGIIDFKQIYLLRPNHNSKDFDVSILFLETKDGGFISGGAAGPLASSESVLTRAFSELIRHSIAIERFLSSKRQPETFYEKRLVHFGNGKSNEVVWQKLNRVSNGVVNLPALEVDSKLSGNYESIIYSHRCLFKDQPPFVGGSLERLCL